MQRWKRGAVLADSSSPSQGFPEVVGWLDEVEPLLASTPLLSVQARTHLLVNDVASASSSPWNTQQVPPEAGRDGGCRCPCPSCGAFLRPSSG